MMDNYRGFEFLYRLEDKFGKYKTEALLRNLCGIPILRLFTYNLPRRSQRYQPSKKYFSDVVHDKNYPAGYKCKGEPTAQDTCPDGYELWLDILEDATGANYFVFYPIKPKKGDSIKVLFSGVWLKVAIEWIHGERGLFSDYIYELCMWENFVYADSEFSEMIEWLSIELQ